MTVIDKNATWQELLDASIGVSIIAWHTEVDYCE